MEPKRQWNWSVFDRSVGVFAAACTFGGAVFAYLAAFPPTPTRGSSSPAGAAMTAGAPWWALALMALSVILLVVSLTRSKRSAVVAPDPEKLAETDAYIEKAVKYLEGLFEAQRISTKNSFEAVWNDLNTQRKSLLTERFLSDLDVRFDGQRENLTNALTKVFEYAASKESVEEHSKRFNPINDDLIRLLHFASDQLTFWMLDDLVTQAPSHEEEAVDVYTSPAERKEFFKLETDFIRTVRSKVYGSMRSSFVEETLRNAEMEAEHDLRKIPSNERPADLDPLDLNKYVVAETQCMRLVALLISQREEKRAELLHQRTAMIQQMQLREKI
jgi:hypothetical protein